MNYDSKTSGWNRDNHYERQQGALDEAQGTSRQRTWSTPGGHLDFGETLEGCAAREAKEEVGVDVVDIRFRTVTNDIFAAEGQHYITVWLEGTPVGEPFIAAQREVEEIGWFDWDALPQPLFLPLENLVKENSYPPK